MNYTPELRATKPRNISCNEQSNTGVKASEMNSTRANTFYTSESNASF
jgi:hypothetical protein